MLRKLPPWAVFVLSAAAGYAGAAAWSGTRRRKKKNPLPRDPAAAFKAFHWGNEPKGAREVDVPEAPQDLVELGELQSVTYATKKGAEVADYFHDFNKTKPTLAYDPDARGLHIVGGDYAVEDRGIVD